MSKGTLQQERTSEIISLFTPVEGYNCLYYGKTRNGKTRTATADILELLKRGEVVYANWKIDFPDYDERDHFGVLLVKFLFGKKFYFKYKRENFHFIDPDELILGTGEVNVAYLSCLVGVHLFFDEAQWILNYSHANKSADPDTIAKMRLVLHGGHYCRSLNIITQRPQNVATDFRSQINIWYRCVKKFDHFGLMIFQRWEIEDMKDNLPLEFATDMSGKGKEIPLGKCKSYFVNKRFDPVFQAYNTHAMRGKDAIEQFGAVEVYRTSLWDRVSMLAGALLPRRKRRATSPAIETIQVDNSVQIGDKKKQLSEVLPVVKKLEIKHISSP